MRIPVKQEWRKQVYNSRMVADILRAVLAVEDEHDRDKEHFWVLGLTTKNQVKYIDLVSLGTLDKTIAEPREVFRLAIQKAVKSVIVAHSHPSGECVPSRDDTNVTGRLRKAGKILGITVLDSLIVTADGHWSAAEEDWR